ncbi:ABC transporter permease [Deinococcus hopiensis]|uniref:Peptide/nickel transport system permease protein n=1 Tax=Deinococcus hopiensis KR-140 TaxID=695939 RepID=A0A1W1VK87_9DEIO|nr:ABC transporter permease [Deinococcus hopiensis]SMB93748.1 peptide/nickel transport system permease protein [Deinococcus hopiensis KR-140]
MTTTAPTSVPKSKARSQSQWSVVWTQFKRNPLARMGLTLLGLLYLMALLAGFLAPYGLAEYSTTERISWAPPTPIHWRDDKGHFGPHVYGLKRDIDMETFRDKYVEDKSVACPVKFFQTHPGVEGRTYRFLGVIPTSLKLFSVDAPCKLYLWGSDDYGRDQFSRIMYGSQISLSIGIIASVLTLVFGLIMGGVAGYFRGLADTVIMRLVEVLSAIPDLFLLITLRALFPLNANPILVFYLVIAILAFIGWGGLARIVRGQILSVREQDFVQAATALGASDSRIIAKHLLPSTATYIIISLSLAIPGFILGESGLSFIGIGIVEPYASWGSLLGLAQKGGFESLDARPWTLIPGVFIMLAVLGWQFVGDGLRDAFDPRRRR